MAQNVTLYNLLISCPGDVKEEVALIESAVDEFNELYAETLGITIKTRHWSKSSYAQSGGKPQDLLNEQFVSKCDAAVAIFWTRFGSPTDEYGSGTEEEIEIMLQSGKQVFMYFQISLFHHLKRMMMAMKRYKHSVTNIKIEEYILPIHQTNNLKRYFSPIFACIFVRKESKRNGQ